MCCKLVKEAFITILNYYQEICNVTADQYSMTLSEKDLREIDQILLEYLREGRVTPVYARERILDEKKRDKITSTYLSQRLQRLEEHNHVQNLYNTGLYKISKDITNK